MFDVMIFAALAVVICVVFYSVLGKQTGFGGTSDEKVDPVEFGMENPNKTKLSGLDAAPDPEIERLGLSAIAKLDPNFSISHFVNGATSAYSMILEAYADGDRDMLRNLLMPETFEIYAEAIDAREKEGQTQVTDLGRLRKVSIEGARLDGAIANIRVLYEADLTSALRDAEGNIVQGDPDVLSSVSEIWEYQRNLKSPDNTWYLSEVEPADGDALEADPSPDTKG